ncbi:HARLDQ motif MBL-fold protein [Novosphingobium endophyticum]|uniref:HARLDQ motif MBL-fold protein n=1 Tax=Novosphingobium endophyticum TaxID=1955250 RepID=A0A916X7J3_9SPHN|nr:subclass B3 metallo-beta-lactamase [Novosphingobium endophyticum]GGC14293.1 HARLDQ motif MBL-fold protein [Novosphingobium endophyticum]
MSRVIKSSVVAMFLAATLSTAALARPASPEWTGERLAGACAGREGWSDPAPPAHIYGTTWYVGTCGIAAILVTSQEGHVLIDGGPADAAPLILANIRKLGFDPADVRWILTSHEHFDHIGGVAQLQRKTGARVAALAAAKRVLETGKPSTDDPQAARLDGSSPVPVARVLADGDSVTLGPLAITVHETPAHSPGSASWTWQACDEKFACRMIAYADSATTISADGYRFTDHPDRVARVHTGHARIAVLPCDVLVTPHPSASEFFARLSGKGALVDAGACRSYARSAEEKFAARLAGEAGSTGE